MLTTYAYDAKDQLVTVYQGSQQRWFAYDSLGRLTRQKLAEQAATINSAGQFVGAGNGQWSDAFVYDARSNLIQRTDARGVKTNYNYLVSGGAPDPLNRLQNVSYDKSQADTTYPIGDASSLNLYYMTAGDKTRVQRVESWWTQETNSYDVEGRILDYTITFPAGTSQPLTTSYLYDSLSRLTEIRYPAAYGMAGAPRKVVNPSYDETSRLKELKVDNQIQMSEIVYNPLSQVTSLKTGASTGNADVEQYSYDQQTGLLLNQKVIKQNTNQSLLDQSYEYNRAGSNGTVNGKTGQLTLVVDNLNHNKNRVYEFDALGRLKTAKGGLAAGYGNPTANWTQSYSYDRYGNRTNVQSSGITQNSQNVPTDGLPTQSYDTSSNRINTSGYQYDLAGNLVRGQDAAGNWQRYVYDAAGRLGQVKDDAGNEKLNNGYTSSRQRLLSWEPGVRDLTWCVWGGQSVIAEYRSTSWGGAMTWVKSYIYAGSRLLSTFTNNGSGGETLEFHHPDRLGTRLVTNNTANTSFEQSTLPFGTALDAETTGTTNQRFTSYDRSNVAQLDYAVNRSYSSGQGRFTSVDPIGMASTSIGNPQSMNLYAYVQNNPVDFTDPSGLFRLGIDPVDAKAGIINIIDQAIAAVSNNSACANLFGSKETALEWLNAYKNNFQKAIEFKKNVKAGELPTGNIGAVVGDKTVNAGGKQRSIITINMSSNYYSSANYRPPGGFDGFSFTEVWAALILHEIGHALTKAGLPTQIQADGIKAAREAAEGLSIPIKTMQSILSGENNLLVRKNCFPKNNTNKNKQQTSLVTGGGSSIESHENIGVGYRDYDPFQSLDWLLFEQRARRYETDVRVLD